jgi:hypothetical protein
VKKKADMLSGAETKENLKCYTNKNKRVVSMCNVEETKDWNGTR